MLRAYGKEDKEREMLEQAAKLKKEKKDNPSAGLRREYNPLMGHGGGSGFRYSLLSLSIKYVVFKIHLCLRVNY